MKISDKENLKGSRLGRRTKTNLLSNKRVKNHTDGTDVFDDYWTDTDQSVASNKTQSFRSDRSLMKQPKRKHPLKLGIGRRTGKPAISGKVVRANEDGIDVFEDYWTDAPSCATVDTLEDESSVFGEEVSETESHDNRNYENVSNDSSAIFPVTEISKKNNYETENRETNFQKSNSNDVTISLNNNENVPAVEDAANDVKTPISSRQANKTNVSPNDSLRKSTRMSTRISVKNAETNKTPQKNIQNSNVLNSADCSPGQETSILNSKERPTRRKLSILSNKGSKLNETYSLVMEDLNGVKDTGVPELKFDQVSNENQLNDSMIRPAKRLRCNDDLIAPENMDIENSPINAIASNAAKNSILHKSLEGNENLLGKTLINRSCNTSFHSMVDDLDVRSRYKSMFTFVEDSPVNYQGTYIDADSSSSKDTVNITEKLKKKKQNLKHTSRKSNVRRRQTLKPLPIKDTPYKIKQRAAPALNDDKSFEKPRKARNSLSRKSLNIQNASEKVINIPVLVEVESPKKHNTSKTMQQTLVQDETQQNIDKVNSPKRNKSVDASTSPKVSSEKEQDTIVSTEVNSLRNTENPYNTSPGRNQELKRKSLEQDTSVTKEQKSLNTSLRNKSLTGNEEISKKPNSKLKLQKKPKSTVEILRRSSRQRRPPLESWRLQRQIYRFNDTLNFIVEIDEGFEDIPSKLKRPKKKSKLDDKSTSEVNDNNRETAVVNDVELTAVLDPHTKREEMVSLHKNLANAKWTSPKSGKGKKRDYSIAKCLSSSNLTSGYIKIKPGGKKDPQYPTENVLFCIFKGSIQVTIENSILTLGPHSQFCVPAYNTYSFKNVGTSEALLSFCTICVPVFKYQEIHEESDQE